MDLGTGISISFGTSSFTADVTSIDGGEQTREAADASHHGLASGSYRPKVLGRLVDAGEISMSILFDPDQQPPIDQPEEEITITFPTPPGGLTGATLVGSGGVTSWSWTGPLEELMTADITITWTATTGPSWTPST